MLCAAQTATALPLLFTFGADSFGAPTGLNSLDPSSSSSVKDVATPLGDGNTGYNGGIVYAQGLLYAVGNDTNNYASIYSFTPFGTALTDVSSDFNTTGDATAFIFQNGLAAIGSTLYGIGDNGSGEDLFQIGNGSASLVRPVSTFGGTYAGLAYDPSLGQFYGVIANATGDFAGDLLVRFGVTGSTTVIAKLTTLDGAEVGTHLGGLADAGGGILYDIYTNVSDGNGELERINLNGSPSVTTLYDTGIPLAQDAGIAVTPEPAPAGALLVVCAALLRKARAGGRKPADRF